MSPDPWALGAALAVGLSPPLLAYGTAVYPETAAAAALAGAALLALRAAERPTRVATFGCFALLATLPWLGTKFLPAGLVVAVLAYRSVVRARRRLLAFAGLEAAALSVAVWVGVNERIYGGPTPYADGFQEDGATGAELPGGYLNRAYRLVALFIDGEYGLLRWAPVFVLAGTGAWLLVRAHRDGLSRVLESHRGVEATVILCGSVMIAQLAVASFLAPTMFGFWFPPRHLLAALPLAVPLVAWGLRHSPRSGLALALLGLAASVWLWLDVRLEGGALAEGRPDAPWGPLEALFPLFDEGRPVPYVLAAAVATALLAAAALEWRREPGIRP